MNPSPQPEEQEINLQEHDIETIIDNSLSAAQIIEDQNDEADASRNNSPRFVP
ncbi:MAG: hypothetical protein HY863_05875 [Chloroflexi bacterium]|nr:hypothetical protein [Chloroflexota bacterium]